MELLTEPLSESDRAAVIKLYELPYWAEPSLEKDGPRSWFATAVADWKGQQTGFLGQGETAAEAIEDLIGKLENA